MSCFVMKKEPLAALANAVAARLNCDYNYWGFEAPASLYRKLKSCAILYHCFSAGKIYCKLYTLNVQAHNGRYLGHQNPCNRRFHQTWTSPTLTRNGWPSRILETVHALLSSRTVRIMLLFHGVSFLPRWNPRGRLMLMADYSQYKTETLKKMREPHGRNIAQRLKSPATDGGPGSGTGS